MEKQSGPGGTSPVSPAAVLTDNAGDGAKAAFVAVVGRPSAGKSTLINRLCGAKVAIVSPVPQTTRNAVRGIVNDPQGQLVLVDTPGRHKSERKFNKRLMETADRAAAEADIILYVLDASRRSGPEEEEIASALAAPAFLSRTIAAVNKIDAPEADIAAAGDFLGLRLPGVRCFNISALRKEGLSELLRALFDLAPPGDPLYPGGYYTDQELSFRIAEIIREKALNRLRQELPHSIYVEVADTELREEDGRQRLWVRAFIMVERESQKGMVVGKGGAMIRAIRLAALKDLDRIFDWKIELDLRVKTAHEWRHNDEILRRFIGR
ncbi:MAG: GTPase Era [Treponema sp.]|jgi:GTP-binding protein Era|nr:GTPase Era [Treponema sp.]